MAHAGPTAIHQQVKRIAIGLLIVGVVGLMSFAARELSMAWMVNRTFSSTSPIWLLVQFLDLVGGLDLFKGLFLIAAVLPVLWMRAYRLAVATSIVAMLPVGPSFLLGLPIGIWALLFLSKPEVKAAFPTKQKVQVDKTKPTESAIEPHLPAATSGKAVASLILGICSFCTFGITGIIGLILGIVALVNINRNPARIKGSGLAIAGMIVSCVSFMFVILQLPVIMPAIFRAKTQAKMLVSSTNLRQLSQAAILYSDDNDGKLPPSASWPEAMRSYYKDKKLLLSPFDPEAGRAYAMNAGLDGRKSSEIQQPARTVLFFECRFGSPPGGGRELLPEPPKAETRAGYQMAFLDGHVERIRPEKLEELIWEPHLRP
ncbi:MAG: DUF4190 domain-containing protein [Planctomycetota bacterium]